MLFSYGLAGDWFIGSGNPLYLDSGFLPMVKLTWASEWYLK